MHSPSDQRLINIDDSSRDHLVTDSITMSALAPRGDPRVSESQSETDFVATDSENSRWKQESPDGWVPLELYFGIPLFDMAVNKQVSEKVRDQRVITYAIRCQLCWLFVFVDCQ